MPHTSKDIRAMVQGVSEIFSGTHITTNFYNDTQVKDFFYFFPETNNKKIARIDDYCLNLQRLHLSVS